jgi:uncharacterized repeat protein (TIGR03806 family)
MCYDPPECDVGATLGPIVEYPQPPGSSSVVGGVVYRGSDVPDLYGTYLFSEFYTGELYQIVYDPVTGDPSIDTLHTEPGARIASFTESVDGEVFLTDYQQQRFYRVTAAGPPEKSTFPATLSATGCFDPTDPTVPVAAMLPYAPGAELWSDGAEKHRWFAIPDGSTIAFDGDGDLDLPVGSVIAKEFVFDGVRAETRLMVRHDDGAWAGYTYKWREDGSDADLVLASDEVEVSFGSWRLPSRSECLQCHTGSMGGTLGLELDQIDRAIVWPATGRTAGQIETLAYIGVLADGAGSFVTRPIPAIDDAGASDEDRARGWMHANCASCHNPGEATPGGMDLRWRATDDGACGAAPTRGDLGVDGALLIDPGSAESSVVWLRITQTDAQRMPPLGTELVHVDAAGTLASWIDGLGGCP